MQRVKLIYDPSMQAHSFNSDWLMPVISQYIEFEPRDPAQTYPTGTLHYLANFDQDVIDQLLDQGFRVVMDYLWEVSPGPIDGVHVTQCDRWFWYNESLWYQHLGYDAYVPNKDVQYRALMPMNRRKPHRDLFLNKIDTSELLWSYCEAGRQLPGDQDMSVWNTQRYFNPVWYDQTYASMVVESLVRPGSAYTPVFITEKTTKPLAFQHPFIVYGNSGTLQTLRSWGFETWNNLWDESYDQLTEVWQRSTAVAKTLADFAVNDYNSETLQKLQHNKDLFFNREKVIRGIIQDIVEPILNYAET